MKQLAVGNAIQVGLMALSGRLPYMPDWHMVQLIDNGPTEFYRYTTRGINDNCAPGEYGHEFSWRVPTVCWRYYWLAELDPGDYYDRCRREALIARRYGTPSELERALYVGD